jgi:hypothetical protein
MRHRRRTQDDPADHHDAHVRRGGAAEAPTRNRPGTDDEAPLAAQASAILPPSSAPKAAPGKSSDADDGRLGERGQVQVGLHVEQGTRDDTRVVAEEQPPERGDDRQLDQEATGLAPITWSAVRAGTACRVTAARSSAEATSGGTHMAGHERRQPGQRGDAGRGGTGEGLARRDDHDLVGDAPSGGVPPSLPRGTAHTSRGSRWRTARGRRCARATGRAPPPSSGRRTHGGRRGVHRPAPPSGSPRSARRATGARASSA